MRKALPLLIAALGFFGTRTAGAVPFEPAQAPASPLILDPGHGGEDLGAVAAGRREKDLALAIALKVKERLESLGAVPVILTRDSDAYVELDERVARGLASDGAAFVSLHLNKVRSKAREGITVYAYGRNRGRFGGGRRRPRKLAPLSAPSPARAASSAELAESLVRCLRRQGLRVDDPARAEFYVLKNPAVPSVLIELGFLSNPQEAEKLADPAYQERLADALTAGLRAYRLAPGASLASTAGLGAR